MNSTHDNIREGGFEDFSVILQNPAGGAGLGTTINASITIFDDDGNYKYLMLNNILSYTEIAK